MREYVAFLRAVNVGGRGVLKMESLERAFLGLGFTAVKTYLAGGNVLFTAAGDEPEAAMAGRIEACLRDTLGIETTVLLRTRREIEKLVRRDPFGDEVTGRNIERYVAFLYKKPKTGLETPIVSAGDGLEIFSIEGREAFVLRRRSAVRYGFPGQFVETKLGVAATTRNWRTVLRIAGKK
ncbi:MAG: DUF1697 domain-containing protein [Acidobacteriota bacterium]|nr:DUF1697 domain-containing protein [Acidobacteriota bacterium]